MRDDEPADGVLSNLPATRPQRRSAKRAAPARKADVDGGAASASTPAPDKHASAAGKQRRSGAPGAGSRAASKPAAAPGAQRRSGTTARGKPAAERQQPARPGAAAQGYEAAAPRQVTPPSNCDILVSAVRAAAELAHGGLTLGERVARAAARRLLL